MAVESFRSNTGLKGVLAVGLPGVNSSIEAVDPTLVAAQPAVPQACACTGIDVGLLGESAAKIEVGSHINKQHLSKLALA